MNANHLQAAWAAFLLKNAMLLARNMIQKIIFTNAIGKITNVDNLKMEHSQVKNAKIDAQRLLLVNATLKHKNVQNVKEVQKTQSVCKQWTIVK